MTKLHVPKPPPPIDTGGSDIHYWTSSDPKQVMSLTRVIDLNEKWFMYMSYILTLFTGFFIGAVTMWVSYGSR